MKVNVVSVSPVVGVTLGYVKEGAARAELASKENINNPTIILDECMWLNSRQVIYDFLSK